MMTLEVTNTTYIQQIIYLCDRIQEECDNSDIYFYILYWAPQISFIKTFVALLGWYTMIWVSQSQFYTDVNTEKKLL